MSSSNNVYDRFKEELKKAGFKERVLTDTEGALKSIGITDPNFINVIRELVQAYDSDPSEHKEAIGAGPIEGKQGYRFHPI